MTLTIGNWILIILCLIVGVAISLYIYFGYEKPKTAIIHMIINILLCVGLIALFNWYNTSTASGIRHYKDFKSEMSNGIYREIIITSEEGREIFTYEGKFDLERHEDGDDRYLRFETQDGKRYTISYGIQDTVIIIEKDQPKNANE